MRMKNAVGSTIMELATKCIQWAKHRRHKAKA